MVGGWVRQLEGIGCASRPELFFFAFLSSLATTRALYPPFIKHAHGVRMQPYIHLNIRISILNFAKIFWICLVRALCF